MQEFEIDVARLLPFEAYEDCWRRVKYRIKSSEWTDGIRYTDQPEYFRRANRSRGRVLKAEPEDKQGCYYYGFDRDGLVLVSRYYGEDGESVEAFYEYGEDYWEVIYYQFTADVFELMRVDRFYHTNERVDVYQLYRLGTSGRHAPKENEYVCVYREMYDYDERGRLSQIMARTWAGVTRTQITDYHLVYDSVGRLDYIEKTEGEADEGYVIYQRPLKGQTLARLQDVVQQQLIAILPSWIEQLAEGRERFYAAVLVYDLADEDYLPPTLILGTTHLRDQLMTLYGDDAADFIWDPEVLIGYEDADGEINLAGKPPYSLEEADEILDEACFLLNQQLAFMNQPERVRDLLNEVARQLMALDWSGNAAVTDDFVIYAVDADFADFDTNFTFSVPAARVTELTTRGLF